MNQILRNSLLIVLLVVGSSCSPNLFVGTLADYEDEISKLQARLVANPADAEALRDMGAIYLRARQFSDANTYLEQAFSHNPDDPKTLFNLGLSNEALARRETALRLYEKFTEVPRLSPYRRLMEGRFEWLTRRMLRDEMQQIALKEPLDTDVTSPRIVAVFPFIYQGTNDRYEPLSRGLAELISIDLANVNDLRVVERVRLQAILDELNLAQTQYMDGETAPRVGRMLGAGRLVSGAYNVVGRENLRLDGAFWEIESASLFNLASQSNTLRDLFSAEKALVFNLINQLGIELSPAERDQIERVPTQNIQAFLAYSRGLQEEDVGAYSTAAGFYQQAARLDPQFTLATVKAEKAEVMSGVDKNVDELIADADLTEGQTSQGVDLVQIRVGLLNQAIGGGFVPGDESRDPAPEAGEQVVLLPEPPPPPPGNQ